MTENPYYSHEFHGDYEVVSIGELKLETGDILPDCKLAIATWGELNEARDNAILITTWYSGTHQPWREAYVGPGRALDPDKYFIVAVNQIGNGLSLSPHNAAGANASIAGSRFPRLSIGDDVVAQERLLRERFGIESLALVTGASMGAQQTWEWAVRFPDKVRRAAPIAGTAQVTPHCSVYCDQVLDSLLSDPGFAGGDYKSPADVAEGLRRQALVWAVMGFSTEFYKHKVHQALGIDTASDFVNGFLTGYFAPMDPNALVCMARKWQDGDVARHTGGDLAGALGRITARTFVLPINEDMFFPVRDCRAEQELVPGSELRVIEDVIGHFAVLGVNPGYGPQVDQHLGELLARDA